MTQALLVPLPQRILAREGGLHLPPRGAHVSVHHPLISWQAGVEGIQSQAYEMTISPHGIRLEGCDQASAHMALHTLEQLWPRDGGWCSAKYIGDFPALAQRLVALDPQQSTRHMLLAARQGLRARANGCILRPLPGHADIRSRALELLALGLPVVVSCLPFGDWSSWLSRPAFARCAENAHGAVVSAEAESDTLWRVVFAELAAIGVSAVWLGGAEPLAFSGRSASLLALRGPGRLRVDVVVRVALLALEAGVQPWLDARVLAADTLAALRLPLGIGLCAVVAPGHSLASALGAIEPGRFAVRVVVQREAQHEAVADQVLADAADFELEGVWICPPPGAHHALARYWAGQDVLAAWHPQAPRDAAALVSVLGDEDGSLAWACRYLAAPKQERLALEAFAPQDQENS